MRRAVRRISVPLLTLGVLLLLAPPAHAKRHHAGRLSSDVSSAHWDNHFRSVADAKDRAIVQLINDVGLMKSSGALAVVQFSATFGTARMLWVTLASRSARTQFVRTNIVNLLEVNNPDAPSISSQTIGHTPAGEILEFHWSGRTKVGHRGAGRLLLIPSVGGYGLVYGHTEGERADRIDAWTKGWLRIVDQLQLDGQQMHLLPALASESGHSHSPTAPRRPPPAKRRLTEKVDPPQVAPRRSDHAPRPPEELIPAVLLIMLLCGALAWIGSLTSRRQ